MQNLKFKKSIIVALAIFVSAFMILLASLCVSGSSANAEESQAQPAHVEYMEVDSNEAGRVEYNIPVTLEVTSTAVPDSAGNAEGFADNVLTGARALLPIAAGLALIFALLGFALFAHTRRTAGVSENSGFSFGDDTKGTLLKFAILATGLLMLLLLALPAISHANDVNASSGYKVKMPKSLSYEQITDQQNLNVTTDCEAAISGSPLASVTFSVEAVDMHAEGSPDAVTLEMTHKGRVFKSHTETLTKEEVAAGASANVGLIASSDKLSAGTYTGYIKVLLTSEVPGYTELDKYSWAELKAASQAIAAGNTDVQQHFDAIMKSDQNSKQVPMTVDGQQLVREARILGIMHDEDMNGNKLGMTFGWAKPAMAARWNDVENNTGGWQRPSEIYTRLQPGGDLYAQIPTEISDLAVSNVKKYANPDYNSSTFNENTWKSSNKFFLESASETWGDMGKWSETYPTWYNQEGYQYEYYTYLGVEVPYHREGLCWEEDDPTSPYASRWTRSIDTNNVAVLSMDNLIALHQHINPTLFCGISPCFCL